jgi:hypothetical protein
LYSTPPAPPAGDDRAGDHAAGGADARAAQDVRGALRRGGRSDGAHREQGGAAKDEQFLHGRYSFKIRYR